ncbi:type II toxin-antitoxin system RelE/ParE family toxin [filamentous cyanobacterium CCP1]|nr:type II toxin-antitoxin system RelE/ParE family toxin [filamentous cyanobacterium CCP1]
MARCRFTPLAKQDLKEINRFIALDNPDAARRFIALIKQKCQTLADFPEMGRSWDDLGVSLRSFPVSDYLIFYRPGMKSGIEVIAVVSGYRDLEALFLKRLLDSGDE